MTQNTPGSGIVLGEPIPTYVMAHLRRDMRIDQNLLKAVVFVGVESAGGFVPTSTGTLVSYQLEDEQFVFLMTCSHEIENLSDASRALLAVRLNRKDGTSDCKKIKIDTRIAHPNRAADMTFFPISVDPTIYDAVPYELNRVDHFDVLEDFGGVRHGDHVCAIGLYKVHGGRMQNVPVVRTGNVAALRGEPVYGARGYTDAYLIELRTIDGLSGSPVFQTFPPVVIKNGRMRTNSQDTSQGLPLGMLIGYHGVEAPSDEILIEDATAVEKSKCLAERNTGFGVVIPIERAFEILEGQLLQEVMRNQVALRRMRSAFRS